MPLGLCTVVQACNSSDFPVLLVWFWCVEPPVLCVVSMCGIHLYFDAVHVVLHWEIPYTFLNAACSVKLLIRELAAKTPLNEFGQDFTMA